MLKNCSRYLHYAFEYFKFVDNNIVPYRSQSRLTECCMLYAYLQRITEKCFKKCISKPGTSLDTSEQVNFLQIKFGKYDTRV